MGPSAAAADVSARPNESTVVEVEAVVGSIVLRIFEGQSVAVAFAAANGIAVAAIVGLVER